MFYFIAGSNEQELTKKICKKLKAKLLKREILSFTGGELKVQVENKDLKEKKVFIIQSFFDNANNKAMELFFLADAIKNLGCKNITAIIPYLGYSRQEKANQGEARALQCVAKLIKNSEIKEIITFDLHNPESIKLFDLSIINLSATETFKDVIKDKKNAIIVAPDIGATHRAQALAEFLKIPFIVATKERSESGKVKIKTIPKIETIAGKDCYLIDDILDTGETICLVAQELERFKPKSINGLISHGVFGNGSVHAILKSCIKNIYITNSINHSILNCSKVCGLDVSSTISNYLKNHGGQ